MSATSTTYLATIQRSVGDGDCTVIKNFLAAASTTYSAGQLVTIDTNGRVVATTTDGAAPDGIVNTNVDNSTGANDAKQVPVIVKGNVFLDAWVDKTSGGGVHSGAFTIGAQCGVGGNGTTSGQVIVQDAALATKKFTSLSIQTAATSTTTSALGLFYFQGSGKFA